MINLPAPISDYFAADTQNGEAVAQCFTDDAISGTKAKPTRDEKPFEPGKLKRPKSTAMSARHR